jgi:hypothetical protein
MLSIPSFLLSNTLIGYELNYLQLHFPLGEGQMKDTLSNTLIDMNRYE